MPDLHTESSDGFEAMYQDLKADTTKDFRTVCGKCGWGAKAGEFVSMVNKSMRSADEGSSGLRQCPRCKHKWMLG